MTDMLKLDVAYLHADDTLRIFLPDVTPNADALKCAAGTRSGRYLTRAEYVAAYKQQTATRPTCKDPRCGRPLPEQSAINQVYCSPPCKHRHHARVAKRIALGLDPLVGDEVYAARIAASPDDDPPDLKLALDRLHADLLAQKERDRATHIARISEQYIAFERAARNPTLDPTESKYFREHATQQERASLDAQITVIQDDRENRMILDELNAQLQLPADERIIGYVDELRARWTSHHPGTEPPIDATPQLQQKKEPSR